MPDPLPAEAVPPRPLPQTAPPAQPPPVEAPDAAKAMTLFVLVVATLYFGREVLIPVTLALLLAFILAPLVELLRRARLGRVFSVILGVLLALGLVFAIGGVIGSQISGLAGDLPKYAETVEKKVSVVRDYTVGRLSRLADRVGMRNAPAPAAGEAGPAPRGAAPAGQEGTGQAGASQGMAAQEKEAQGATGQGATGQGTAAQGGGGQRATAQGGTAQGGTVQGTAASAAPAETPLQIARRTLSTILSPLETLGIVFVVAIFALLQREDLRDRLIRLAGSGDLHRATAAIDDGARRLSRYFLTQLCINTIFGVVVGTGLYFIGVPSAVLWGILSGLLRFIPYVGAFLAAGLPMALAAAVDPGWSMLAWTAGLYVVIELATAQVIEPMVYGHSTGLSPFSVVVAAIFWSWVWGPVGLILSTPLTLILVVMGRHVPRLEFLDILLGDRPALTPAESFYQRVLAGDADEAQDQAELLLKERSLTAYYDEVALKGLQLAANDARREVVDRRQLDRIRDTVAALVEGLGEHGDVPPPPPKKSDDRGVDPAEDENPPTPKPAPPTVDPARDALPAEWRGPTAVLCVAGRGPLDESASAMLAQLLGKHGLGARMVPYEALSRDRVETLDMTGVAMACVSYLDISGSPAHLRYLVRRLRQKLPRGAPLLVGLWPEGDAALSDRTVRTAIGADHFTSSLAEAVAACVEAARAGEGATVAAPAKAAE